MSEPVVNLPPSLRESVEAGGRLRPPGDDLDDNRFLARASFEATLSALDTWDGPGRAEAVAAASRALDAWPDAYRRERAMGEEALNVLLASPSWPLVRSLEVRLPDLDAAARFSERPELAGLRALDVQIETPLDPETVRRLLGSPHLAGLRSLRLGEHYLRDPAAAALAEMPRLERLESLSLPSGAAAVLESGRLGKLTRLELTGGIEEAEALARRLPPSVRRLSFTDLEAETGAAAVLARSEALARVVNLTLCGIERGDEAAEALAENRSLVGLERLAMGSSWVEIGGLYALGRAAFLENLTALDLGTNPIGDAGWESIANWPLHRLRKLSLVHTRGGDSGAVVLARSPHLRKLDELWLGNNRVGPEGLAALAAAPWLEGASTVDLEMNPVEDPAPLVGSAAAANLKFLSVGEVDREGLLAVAASPHLGRLEYLGVGCHGLDAECVAALGRSAAGKSLTNLLLAYDFGDACARALVDAPGFDRLRSFRPFGDLTEEGVGVLAESPKLAGLWVLKFGLQRIGAAGAIRLAASPYLRSLVDLDLLGARTGPEAASTLAASPVARTLRHVMVDETEVPVWSSEPNLLPVLRARAARLYSAPDPY